MVILRRTGWTFCMQSSVEHQRVSYAMLEDFISRKWLGNFQPSTVSMYFSADV
jgi:hypothetical protein